MSRKKNEICSNSKNQSSSRSNSIATIENRDALLRMSFLYQAANWSALRSGTMLKNNKTIEKHTSKAKEKTHKKSKSAANKNDHSLIDESNKFSFGINETKDLSEENNQNEMKNGWMGRFYLHNMKTVAKKSQSRIDPYIKRTICKKCNGLMIPGISSDFKYQVSKTHNSQMVEKVYCLYCHHKRTLIMNPNYTLFQYRKESILNENKQPN